MNKKEMNNKGFSLVELIIVIAIMAILIGVLAPQFIKYVEQSRESTDLQNVEEIKTAIEAYVADNGDTVTADITVTLNKAPGVITSSAIANLSEYGIASTGIKTKSAQWPDSSTYTYHITTGTKYSWTNPTGAATYYNLDGTKVGASTSTSTP